ncbi:cysteine protease StiP family protein [Butyrivibrio sp. VCB2001]|uniref:cysteine protease StiP family protein n=1 Tax=Butyrivibrio sp. VCB2001 TaxID=1280667 RepID=UPI0004011937|nr:cysteine protease StiP family protein [Butyrivibrio sp. VCB2001]
MRSSFNDVDVELLLKDITGLVEPLPTEEREKKIQSGIHYSEMLPLEYKPSDEYIRIYTRSLDVFGQTVADAIVRVSEKIVNEKGNDVVIVSLARAGTPIGVLISRYIRKKYAYVCPHYSISIIRDRGIDRNAMEYILKKHCAASIQFVDGWTGKGVIYNELKKEISSFHGVSGKLAVVADPAYITDLCGTHDDILIPSSCLNSTVCGLISRTFLRSDIIGADEFHGALFYKELIEEDRTYEFIHRIEELFRSNPEAGEKESTTNEAIDDIRSIAEKFGIADVNHIKPGIGETTRVLLRRVPWKIIIDERYKECEELKHILQLALEKKVAIYYTRLNNYKCCGLIKQLSDV